MCTSAVAPTAARGHVEGVREALEVLMSRKLVVVVLGVVGLVGCDGGQSGEETIVCAPVATTELGEDEASVLGFGRADVVGIAGGDHAATLTWAAGGDTPMTLSLALGSARYHDREWVNDGTGELASMAMELDCPDIVEVDADGGLVTDDGAFDEGFETKVQASSASDASFYAGLDLAALGGTFVLEGAEDYDEVTAAITGLFVAGVSTGSIDGQGTKTEGSGPDGTVSATNLPIASW